MASGYDKDELWQKWDLMSTCHCISLQPCILRRRTFEFFWEIFVTRYEGKTTCRKSKKNTSRFTAGIVCVGGIVSQCFYIFTRKTHARLLASLSQLVSCSRSSLRRSPVFITSHQQCQSQSERLLNDDFHNISCDVSGDEVEPEKRKIGNDW